MPAAGAKEPPTAQTPAEAADAVLAAVKAGQQAALKALAARAQPDPWRVADVLVGRGLHDAALAFARAGRGRDVAKLPAYITSRRGAADDTASRKAWRAAEPGLASGDLARVEAAFKGLQPDLRTVIGVHVASLKALLLRMAVGIELTMPEATAAAEAAFALGWYRQAARIYHDAGAQAFEHSDFPTALDAYERGLRVQKARANPAGIATTHHDLGNVHAAMGALAKAQVHYERALQLRMRDGTRADLAATRIDLGSLFRQLGEYGRALESLERGVRDAEAAGHKPWTANGLEALGAVHAALGEPAQARDFHERALKIREALGDALGVASTLHNFGVIEQELGNNPEALGYFRRAFTIRAAQGDLAGLAQTSAQMGAVHASMGNNAQAVAHYEKALELQRRIGDHAGQVHSMAGLGVLRVAMGDRGRGLELLERAARQARMQRDRLLLARLLTSLAAIRLDAGETERALATAREALGHVQVLSRALGGLRAGGARTAHGDIYGIGAAAALRSGDLPGATQFLEAGRAGSLLDQLSGRRARAAAVVPEALRKAEAEARKEARQALAAYRDAVTAGDAARAGEHRRALEAARLRLRDIALRIQRAAAAGQVAPRPATLEAIRKSLRPGEALVLYGLHAGRLSALVLTPAAAKAVDLGTAGEALSSQAAFEQAEQSAVASAALARLRTRLVEPLALPKEVRQVLVSAAGPLWRLPFGALFGRPVALMPSGSVLVLLRNDARTRGKGVLAVTDGTRADFDAALTRQTRWRALHFVRPVEIDSEHPLLSSVLLTPGPLDDGRLTCLDLLRMRVPADLVTLAGDRTATGKIVRGEGVVGLASAFMAAGVPRVIGSLWPVDDEATRVLMLRFYELWNPTRGERALGAAAALHAAQAHVRARSRWAHPRYWAGWVLWGLP